MGAMPQNINPDSYEFRNFLSSLSSMRRSKPEPLQGVAQPKVISNKGISWSEAEHLGFLNGLKAFGRGQWKQISRYYVPSRTPTQVASHAQKHFLRTSGSTKRRSRFTTLDDLPSIQPPQNIQQPDDAPALSDDGAAVSSFTGASARMGAPLGALPANFAASQHQVHPHPIIGGGAESLSFALPPPVDENGVALGIPIQQNALATGTTNMTSAGNAKIPMLPVQQGRLNLKKMYTSSNSVGNKTSAAPISMALPVQLNGGTPPPKIDIVSASEPLPQPSVPRREIGLSRRSRLEHMRELKRERANLNALNPSITRRVRQRGSPDSHSGSVCSDTTSAPQTAALDALAGVAAALADSAANE